MKKAILILTTVMILIACAGFVSAGIGNAWSHGKLMPEVKNCMQHNDDEYIIVEADVSGSATPNLLEVNGFAFTECSSSGAGSHCIYDPELESPGALVSGSVISLNIVLYRFGSAIDDTKEIDVIVDGQGPVIKNFEIKRAGTAIGAGVVGPNTNIEISYDVEDNCAGFKESWFTVEGEEKASETRVEKNIKKATITHSLNVADIKPSGGWTNEPVQLCVTAKDHFDQPSNKVCLELTVDDTPAEFRNLRVNGKGILLTNGKGTVDVAVQIDDLSDLEVTANFKEINGNDREERPYKCDKSGPSQICRWTATVYLTAGGTKTITFKAKDEFGKESEASFPLEVIFDDKPPVIVSFTSIYGTDYVKERNNRFKAIISDVSGVEESGVKIDLAALFGHPYEKYADSCEETESGYECKWSVAESISGNQGDTRTIYLYAEDIIGNSADVPEPLVLTIDKTIPVLFDQEAEEGEILTNDNKIRIRPSYSPLEDQIVGSSTLTITALVKDDTQVYAFADLRNIIEDADAFGDDIEWEPCGIDEETEEGIYWTCVINTEPTMLINGPKDIQLYFIDSAGNEINVQERLYFKTTGIKLVPRIEVYSNEYRLQEEGEIIGTSTLDIKAYISSPVNPIPRIEEAKLIVPASLGISKAGKTTIDGDCSDIKEIDDVMNVICRWNTKDWKTDRELSGKVPREPRLHELRFNFEDELGNPIRNLRKVITVIEPRPLEIMDVKFRQDLVDIFPGGTPPHFRGNIVSEYPVVISAIVNHPGYLPNVEENAKIIKEESYADFSELFEETSVEDWTQVEVDSCVFHGAGENETAYWECTWSSSITNAEVKNVSRRINLDFHIKDVQENVLEASKEFRIIRKKDVTDEQYWKVTSIAIFPEVVDRQTAAILSQRVEARIELEPTNGYEILLIGAKCSGDTDYIDGNIKIRSQYTNSPWIYFDLKAKDITADKMELECTLSIMFKEEDYIYTAPTELNISLEIPFYGFKLGELSQSVKDKIDGAMDNSLVNLGFIGTASKLLGQFMKICRLVYTLIDISNAFADLEMVTAPLQWNPFTRSISQAAHKISDATDVSSKGIVNNLYKFCQYVMCDKTLWGSDLINYNQFLGEYGYLNPEDTETRKKYSGYSWFEQYGITEATFWPANPSDSLILSAATGCLPGIINNLQKVRNIECTYAICLYETSREGLSIAPCEKEKDFAYCKYVYGQVFELIPFKSFFEWITTGISQVFNDPLSTLVGIRSWNCRHIQENAAHAQCVFGDFDKVEKLLNVMGSLERAKTTLAEKPPGDVCKQAESILSKMNTAEEPTPEEVPLQNLEGTA